MCEDGYCDCHRRCSKCGKLKGPAPYPYTTYPYGWQRPMVYPNTYYNYPLVTTTTAAPQAQWASAGSAVSGSALPFQQALDSAPAGSTIQYTMKTG